MTRSFVLVVALVAPPLAAGDGSGARRAPCSAAGRTDRVRQPARDGQSRREIWALAPGKPPRTFAQPLCGRGAGSLAGGQGVRVPQTPSRPRRRLVAPTGGVSRARYHVARALTTSTPSLPPIFSPTARAC